MSGNTNDGGLDLSRRTFLKAAGVAAGAGAVGAGAGTASAGAEVDERLLNWRAVEARKVWNRGYRGRPDRSLALTDSGISGRHADLAPWNDAVIETDGDGITVRERNVVTEQVPVPTTARDRTETFSDVNAGAGAVGLIQRTDYFTLEDPTVSSEPQPDAFGSVSRSGGTVAPGGGVVGFSTNTDPFTFDAPEADYDREVVGYRIDATLTWQPANDRGAEPSDMDVELQKRAGDGWTTVKDSGRGGTETQSDNSERVVATGSDGVTDGTDYRFVVYNWRGIETEWTVEASLEALLEPQGDTASELVDPGFEIDATLTWNADNPGPQQGSVEMVLEDGSGNAVASAGPGGTAVSDDNRASLHAQVTGGDYRFVVTTWRGVAQWEIEADVLLRKKQYDDGTLVTEEREVVELDEYDGALLPDPGEVGPDTPKVVGWYDAGPDYGSFDRPRDRHGHGSHVSGIMAGTGRGSTVDPGTTEVHEPHAVLVPGDFLEYEVEVPATGSVFASALGDNVVVEIAGPDGRVVHESPLREDSVIADEPAVHDAGTETYTVRVKPYETEGSGTRAYDGNPTAGRADTVAVGTYTDADDTLGARTDGNTAVHPGLAPNASLVGLQGLGAPTDDLNTIADDLASRFNVRAVNMSWGPVGGVPVGMFGGVVSGAFDGDVLGGVKTAAEAGILTVAAAGNAFTPANGNGYPAVADEAISVVATGPLDGITSYSSGGVGAVDEDDVGFYMKPDVTAPGGDVEPDAASAVAAATADAPYPVPSRYELVRSVRAADPDANRDPFEPRDYVSSAGTSMASPYVCGVAGLVAQAMEEDAPEPIRLPAPGEAGFEDVMRLKQAVLATATETAFTAAPYHAAKNAPGAPTYDHGGRDPYEGYGRVNPDAAVDAVTRDLFAAAGATPPVAVGDGGSTHGVLSGEVGLNVPVDSRAVAGYVTARGGTLDVSVDAARLTGANSGMAAGDPHVDLFVYDAERPAANGEPNVVASATGVRGTTRVSVDVEPREYAGDDLNRRTFFVVAKLVNVPGVVNGYDVQVHLDVDLSFQAATVGPRPAPDIVASGSRDDAADAYTGGQTARVALTDVDVESADPDRASLPSSAEVRVVDRMPEAWTYDAAGSDGRVVDGDGDKRVVFGPFTVAELRERDELVYYARAPNQTGRYTFGEARVELLDSADFRGDPATDAFGGTDTNVVAGPSTDTDETAGTAAEDAGGTADSTTGGATDGVTDTVEDAAEDATGGV